MLILAAVVLAVALVPLTGGRLRLLAELQWRAPWLVLLALLTQMVVLEVPGLAEPVSSGAHVLTYVMAATFVWLNRSVRGLALLAVGAAANGVTIVLNGGTLPSSAAARELAGLDEVAGFSNSAVVDDPVLGFLGDIFAVPAGVPLANVFSIGDVLIVAGAAWVIHAATRPRPGADPQELRRAEPPATAPLASRAP